jgi:Tfp pilus assembly protein PilO
MKFKPIYLWALLPVVLIIGWVMAFYGPASGRKEMREKELTAIMAEKQVMEKEIERLTALRKREGETKSRMDTMSADIPRYGDLPAFMKRLTQSARAKGVFVEDLGTIFSSFDEQRVKTLANPLFEITVKGRYLPIGRFLEELENNKAFTVIRKASLSYEEAQYPVLTGKFVLQFKARKE